jgi:aconitate hydratase
MAQKILAGRAAPGPNGTLSGDFVEVKVDQIVLARAPSRAFADALAAGMKKTGVELAMAYDGRCVTDATCPAPDAAYGEMLAHGVQLARPGVGFPAAVHLERFAAPARLCVTDEPRLAGVGGVGMLSLVVAPAMLGQALAHGTVLLRPPRSVQVLLSGRTRPFVCARDVALELLRRGLGDVVRRVEERHRAPVVIEFAGPSVRLLSVGERSVLASLAPRIGAAAAVFVSDERTEVYLRDQRRSKAYRALSPDAGAPCEEVVNVDLAATDPLLLDETGAVRAVRELAGKPVSQVVLGGDSGVTLRDLLAAAALLKAKRVPPSLDLLVAVPSRQMLEVLGETGALTDLVANGARLVEPDARVLSGALYPPDGAGLSARSFEPEPSAGAAARAVVASAETLAYAVAHGEMGDPRTFKRPVRVIVPRGLPTDDVLVVRERRAAEVAKKTAASRERASGAGAVGGAAEVPAPAAWKAAQTLEVVPASAPVNGKGGLAVVCSSLDEVRQLAARAPDVAPAVRAILASFIPSGTVSLLSGVGIAAIECDAAALKRLEGQRTIALPAPSQWAVGATTAVPLGGAKVPLTWLARGAERAWAAGAGAGTARK